MRSPNLPVLVRAANVVETQASLVPVPATIVFSCHAWRDSQGGTFEKLEARLHLNYILVKTRCGSAIRLLADFQYNV
jgi:hypothetical protein